MRFRVLCGFDPPLSRGTKANSNKNVMLFALSDKKQKTTDSEDGKEDVRGLVDEMTND